MNSIRNFRDLGGTKSKYGIIKQNRLLRGGPLNNLTLDDQDHLLNQYELRTIIDFRSDHEVISEPNKAIENIQLFNFKIIPELTEEEVEKVNAKDNFMEELYKLFVSHEQALNSYKQFVEVVAKTSTDGAAYFHCTAGKDRTGFGAAILLKILGVSDEDIFKDFLETNNNIARDKASLEASFDDFNPFDGMDEEMLYDILGVKASYLETSFALINELYGSFDNFIEDALEIKQTTINALIENLII